MPGSRQNRITQSTKIGKTGKKIRFHFLPNFSFIIPFLSLISQNLAPNNKPTAPQFVQNFKNLYI
jgi:hypothetical protein